MWPATLQQYVVELVSVCLVGGLKRQNVPVSVLKESVNVESERNL